MRLALSKCRHEQSFKRVLGARRIIKLRNRGEDDGRRDGPNGFVFVSVSKANDRSTHLIATDQN